MRIVLKDEVSSAERDAMIAPLLAHNAAQGVDFTNSPFALALEDDDGHVVGGVTGYSRWGWLYLASVAVPAELRGQGWGRRLIEVAETAAVQRGCRYIWLDTYSFQARPFYEKLGYRVFGQLSDHPPGHTRPILIIHGSDDEIVPVSQAEYLYRALNSRNTDVTFIRVERGNHGCWPAGQPYPSKPLPCRLEGWMLGFLEKHLQGKSGFDLHGVQRIDAKEVDKAD